jgi:Domain of unknown function (DUF4440)
MRTTSLAISLLILTLGALGQNSEERVKLAIQQVLERQPDAWNHHDLEGFMASYWNSSQLTFFSGAKLTSGWQSSIERDRKTYQSEGREMGKLDVSDLNIQPLAPDAAFVRGAWRLTMPDGKTPPGLFTLIFDLWQTS